MLLVSLPVLNRIRQRAVNKSPIVEVWIDRPSRSVERVLDPPDERFYDGMPVPVF